MKFSPREISLKNSLGKVVPAQFANNLALKFILYEFRSYSSYPAHSVTRSNAGHYQVGENGRK